MRKLSILKAIVDWLWIASIITTPIIIIAFGFLIFGNSINDLKFSIFNIKVNSNELYSKMILVLPLCYYLGSVYCLYLFRETIKNIQKINLFDNKNIKNFNIIGKLLIAFSFIEVIAKFLIELPQGDLNLNISMSPFLITLILGLFFMVLSEIFKIAKNQKQENDLTI